ncbi:hypothetical protein AGMMS50268_11570 [Spirochaetia bacterium]|nr:hypothetical protein AGMMS50268_11570 [Spirochaetia bacterium]
MPLLTQYHTFFVSPFGETSVCDDAGRGSAHIIIFLKSNRIINVVSFNVAQFVPLTTAMYEIMIHL